MSKDWKGVRKWATRLPERRALQTERRAAANTALLVGNVRGASVIGEERVRGRVV